MADKLWVERNCDGTWQAHSSDNATIRIGKGEGMFNPGDLIKVALAACGGLSSEAAVKRLLGDGAKVRIDVSGDYDSDNDRYNSFSETVSLEGEDSKKPADDAEAAKVADRVSRHIAKDCTIAHTFRQATPVDIRIDVKR